MEDANIKKRRKIDEPIETISITVYTRQLKRIDEELNLPPKRLKKSIVRCKRKLQ
jgi:hypothetical protein